MDAGARTDLLGHDGKRPFDLAVESGAGALGDPGSGRPFGRFGDGRGPQQGRDEDSRHGFQSSPPWQRYFWTLRFGHGKQKQFVKDFWGQFQNKQNAAAATN